MVWVLPAIIWLAAAPQRPRWGRAMAAATAVLFWAAPIWWVPNGNLRPLHENSWQLLAGNSFFAWMILFLAAIAASALWRTPTADKTAEKPRPAGADSHERQTVRLAVTHAHQARAKPGTSASPKPHRNPA